MNTLGSRILGLFAVGSFIAVSGCSMNNGSEGDDVTAKTAYVSIHDFKGSAYDGAFYDIQSKLNQEFNDVCGDTFCEGDFSNLTPLSLNCSVTSVEGSVHDCAWTFGGSLESVDPKTSAITVDAPTFQCHFHAKTTAGKLVTLLSGSNDAIHETLPGTTGSIYDSLVDCFQHPIGATPISFPDETGATYVEASDFYSRGTSQAKWSAAKTALKAGFDNICGDTYCGSDYGDLQSMSFVCSVTKSSGNVKSCAWVFTGSFADFPANGTVAPTSKAFICPVPVKGTLSQLITTLTAPGNDQAIDRPLPGQTTSAYDALGNCLP